jgi:PKD domain
MRAAERIARGPPAARVAPAGEALLADAEITDPLALHAPAVEVVNVHPDLEQEVRIVTAVVAARARRHAVSVAGRLGPRLVGLRLNAEEIERIEVHATTSQTTLAKLALQRQGVVGKRLTFAVSPTDVWAAVRTVSWSFGDGTCARGKTVAHSYTRPGR